RCPICNLFAGTETSGRHREHSDMTPRAVLRASDADREQIAERLRRAATEGRLHDDELEERLGAAFSARTYGELDTLVADLPSTTVDRPRPQSPARPRSVAA